VKYLVFDIETAALPLDDFDERQREFLFRGCANDEERKRAVDLMALNPFTARVISIGMLDVASLDAEPRGCVYSSVPGEPTSGELADGTLWRTMAEADLLRKWWEIVVHSRAQEPLHLVSFNGRNFDCPFLMLRSAIHRVRPSRNLMDGTRWQYKKHTDLADELTFKNGSKDGVLRRFNFDFYCRSFGIPTPKTDEADGSKVAGLYRDGKHREIAEYCMRDVRATWSLFKVWKEYLDEIRDLC
jgi:hypothetical protein